MSPTGPYLAGAACKSVSWFTVIYYKILWARVAGYFGFLVLQSIFQFGILYIYELLL